MNIKEIALQLAHRKCTSYEHVPVDMGIRYSFSDAHLIDFAEALVAELAKGNEPVAWMYEYSYDLNGDKQGHWPVEMYTHVSFSRSKPSVESTPLYTLPPTAEQLVFRNERLVADYASLQEENNALRRIHAENLVIKDAEIARWKTVPMKYRRMEFNAQLQEENAALKEQVVTLEKLQGVALIESLRAEVAHWKNNHETEVRRARVLKERTDMPIERVQAYEKWGEDQRKLATLQLEAKRLREALEEFLNGADECLDDGGWTAMVVSMEAYHICDEALSSPTSTDALDAYVAEKQEIIQALSIGLDEKTEQISELTKQRDLAVSALECYPVQGEFFMEHLDATHMRTNALSTLKESET